MTTGKPQEQNSSRRRRHFPGYRRVKVMLLALGVAGLVLGFGITAWFALYRNATLIMIGIIYMLVSAVLLGLRGIIIYMGRPRNNTN
jgi:uncharacterized ion transporter superfamily protein YfcC